MAGILDLGATRLAELIRAGELHPVEVVDAHIRRVLAVNPAINAVVAERFEAARAEARAAADRRARSRPEDLAREAPLLGVPCTVKEFIGVRGMPQTGGVVYRWNVRADRDATVVARLRRAGAVVLGVTNAPEGGLWMETNNLVWGRTRNPWDIGRTPGGSSGGEGAIVAAGGSPFGLGSDVGGSIRIPAAFCGVAGHKPTGRRVPGTGHWPPVEGEVGAYNCIGPLARRVEDLWTVLRVVEGPDGEDALTRTFGGPAPTAVDPRRIVVHPLFRVGRARARPVMRDAVERAAAVLVDRGATRSELVEPRLKDVFSIWSAMLAEASGASYARLLGDGQPIPVLREVLRFPFGRSNHTTPALAVVLLEAFQRQLPGRVDAYVAAGRALREQLEAVLGDDGVLVLPPYTRPAPRHRAAMLTPFDIVYTALFNVLEFPATVVPVGFDEDGLPVAVQVVAARGRDHLALAAAAAIEADLGGWRRADPPRDGLDEPSYVQSAGAN